MKYHLVVIKKNTVYHFTFNTMTEAYHYYLKHYATFGDWFYTLRVSHQLLCCIKDENIMRCCFDHAFEKNVACFQARE